MVICSAKMDHIAASCLQGVRGEASICARIRVIPLNPISFFTFYFSENVLIIPDAIILDRTRLRQVLLNLVGNAVKFTGSGQVSITVVWKAGVDNGYGGSILEIEVADTGIGIPEEDRGEIFEAFRQRSSQDQARYGGTGLGLAICKKLVALMNGDIRVDGNPAGKGSVFIVMLHNVKAADRLPMQDGDPAGRNGIRYLFQPARILVADDVDQNHELLKAYLEGHPFDYIAAWDGEEALQKIRKHRPDLVLTDIKMPRLNGVDLAKAAAADPAISSIPIIAVTASAMPSDLENLGPHVQAILIKPLRQGEAKLRKSPINGPTAKIRRLKRVKKNGAD